MACMARRTRSFPIIFLAFLLGAGCAPATVVSLDAPNNSPANTSVVGEPVPAPIQPASNVFGDPLDDAESRITKKTFGLYVTPTNSPVSPERFTGYHAGVDFETTSGEQGTDVLVQAICPGTLVLKKWASGYGGVAVERCVKDGADITVVYGHLLISSISATVGDTYTRGERIGVLGKGYSTETDGERKHLHLGIHQGSTIDIRGYVSNRSYLAAWIGWPGK